VVFKIYREESIKPLTGEEIMKKVSKKYIILLLLLSMTTMAQLNKPGGGGTILGGGCAGGLAIPDDGYDGTIGSMQCMTIAGLGGLLTDINLDLAVDHTFVGDLAVKIVAPDGTILTVMNRPGFAEPADDGTGGFGFGSDISSAAIVTYANGAATSAEDMGLTAVGVVCQDDGLCDYAPSPGLGEGVDFNDYIGMESAGNW